MFGETIDIIREGERLLSTGWAVAPVTATETSVPQGSFDTVGYTLYKPEASETILATDRIVVRGRMHAVEGVASDWESPFACGAGGVVVHVKRIN